MTLYLPPQTTFVPRSLKINGQTYTTNITTTGNKITLPNGLVKLNDEVKLEFDYKMNTTFNSTVQTHVGSFDGSVTSGATTKPIIASSNTNTITYPAEELTLLEAPKSVNFGSQELPFRRTTYNAQAAVGGRNIAPSPASSPVKPYEGYRRF
ncbi:hypothetical protein [Amylolactobacillus amylophilus]|uniref:hypothetical protein n=1 Tax=Amylolactobacillus amylophilus TaxID=1603 RepID=UPI0006D0E13F|nr:hypothetical protein [Amylolactobacillus amylophilus]